MNQAAIVKLLWALVAFPQGLIQRDDPIFLGPIGSLFSIFNLRNSFQRIEETLFVEKKTSNKFSAI